MKVMVTAVSFSSEISGVQRHALNLVRCLLLRPEISRLDLVVSPWQAKLMQSAGYCSDDRITTHVAAMDESSLSRNLWYYRDLPSLAARLQPDVVHLSYPVPVDADSLTCPTVLTLHDLYPYEIPRNFRFPHVIFNRLILRHCLTSVDAIACVSETTMLRLRQYAPDSTWRKAVRIYNCVEPEPLCATYSPIPGWQGESFLLTIAQHRRNKNIPLLIRAFHRLLHKLEIDPSMKLVVVGIDGPETQRIHRLVSQLKLSRSVLLLRGLSEPELQWCYARCEALVVPSRTEGFGLPVAEGLLAGCRVICSDIPAFREVGGSHCRFVALGKTEVEALAAAIRETLHDPPGNPISLPHLSAEVLANQYLSLYRTLIPSDVALSYAERPASMLATTQESGALWSRTNQHTHKQPRFIISTILKDSLMSDSVFAQKYADVLGVKVSAIDLSKAVDLADRSIAAHNHGYICVTGVHGVMEAQKDAEFRRILNQAFINTPDGMPMSWVGHLQGFSQMDRVCGSDFMAAMCQLSVQRGYRHFLYGGEPGVAELLKETLQKRFPGLQVVGIYTPPFRKLNTEEERQILTKVRESNPHILWVGLSTPKQERFMAQYIDRLQVPLLVGVGAAFDFHTGRIRDCSNWIKRAGLQWLHRLLQDPRRLWKRYLRNNPAFVWNIALQLLNLRQYPPSSEIDSSKAEPPIELRS